MFKVNDTVVHYRDGIAVITGTTLMAGNEYFVLSVKRAGGVNVYVPIGKANNVIRNLLTHEEVDKLLSFVKNAEENFIGNTKQRRDDFKKRLATGDVYDLIYLCKLLYLYKTLPQLPEGVKFGPMDVEMLYDAHNRLFDEFAVIFSVAREEIEKFITKRANSI
jgi:RNA polymerase-interacting CarD/CdnL/TRCF family regulator